MDEIIRWGVEWYSRNALDGVTRHPVWMEPNRPALFGTRKEAREWIQEKYGYIRLRRDLREEPHGWRMPRAVRVRLTISTVG